MERKAADNELAWQRPCGCMILCGVPVLACSWHRGLIISLQTEPLTQAVIDDIILQGQPVHYTETTDGKSKKRRYLPSGFVLYTSRGGHYGS